LEILSFLEFRKTVSCNPSTQETVQQTVGIRIIPLQSPSQLNLTSNTWQNVRGARVAAFMAVFDISIEKIGLFCYIIMKI
jgi:hypothetical protein